MAITYWRGADGHPIRDANGHLIRCDTCPCTPTCPDAASLSVVFSGVTSCAGCIGPIISGAYFKVNSISLSGLYTVTGGAGFWQYDIINGANISVYSDSTCTTLITTADSTINIQVQCFTGGLFGVTVVAAIPGQSENTRLFGTATTLLISTAIPNENTCTGTEGASAGTSTVSL